MVTIPPFREKQLRQLVQKLGLAANVPVQWSLLDLALTHPSISAEANFERLEFVGDAVVRLAAAEFLYETYPALSEGELSALRSLLVSDRHLATVGDRYNLERYLLLGPSAQGDKLGRVSRTAAALEALLAALYLSTTDLQLIRPWFDPHLREFSEQIRQNPALHNAKGALQALTQGRYQVLPDYRVTEVEPSSHASTTRFTAEVWVNGELQGQGSGASKKEAEQAAALKALENLGR